MASDSSFPPVASSIGSAVASLSTTMKRLTREKRTEDDPERMVFSLLLNYHKSLRRGGLFRRARVRKESANPFAYDGVKDLESYYYAMRLLYALPLRPQPRSLLHLSHFHTSLPCGCASARTDSATVC